jgi:hypothetical protein
LFPPFRRGAATLGDFLSAATVLGSAQRPGRRSAFAPGGGGWAPGSPRVAKELRPGLGACIVRWVLGWNGSHRRRCWRRRCRPILQPLGRRGQDLGPSSGAPRHRCRNGREEMQRGVSLVYRCLLFVMGRKMGLYCNHSWMGSALVWRWPSVGLFCLGLLLVSRRWIPILPPAAQLRSATISGGEFGREHISNGSYGSQLPVKISGGGELRLARTIVLARPLLPLTRSFAQAVRMWSRVRAATMASHEWASYCTTAYINDTCRFDASLSCASARTRSHGSRGNVLARVMRDGFARVVMHVFARMNRVWAYLLASRGTDLRRAEVETCHLFI